MKPNPISNAFDHVEVDPSPTFRDNLRAQFVAAMTHPEQDQTINKRAEDGVTVAVIEAPTIEPKKQRRPSIIVGIAAAIIVIAALAVVVLTRPSKQAAVKPSDDSAIAESALMTEQQLKGWTILVGANLTTRQVEEVAATVPACTPYLDYAFDSPRRDAVTRERDFRGTTSNVLTQLVYLFPTEAAATEAMNKIAEPGFVPCFNTFISALTATGGAPKADTSTAEAPPFAEHGDRQIVVPQTLAYRGGPTQTVISFFVQVGRGIVYVDPLLLRSDPLDSKGNVEKTVAAATDALAAALR